MDPNVLIALWSGKLPEGFVPPAIPGDDLPTCSLCAVDEAQVPDRSGAMASNST